MHKRCLAVLGALSAAGAVACNDVSAPEFGAIRIVTSTTGLDMDAGYGVRVGYANEALPILPNASIIVAGVPTGSVDVLLTDIAANCGQHVALKTAVVVASDTVDVPFNVVCVAAVGVIDVAPTVTGADRDTTYLATLDSGPPTALTVRGIRLQNVPAGNHTVKLTGLETNCTTQESMPAEVAHGQITIVNHAVTCQARVGRIRVQTSTSGEDLDANGYNVVVEDYTQQHVVANGLTTIANVREGTYTVRLDDVQPNCSVAGGSERTVTLQFGATVDLNFVLTCTAFAAVRIAVTGSGVDIDPQYMVRVTGTTVERYADVLNNNAVTISGFGAGTYSVSLDGVAIHCDLGVATPSPRSVTLTAGTTTDVAFDVACVAAREIAFAGPGDEYLHLYTGKSSGTASVVRRTSAQGDDHHPAWSPDGGKIAFTSTRDGNVEIYVMNADGTGQSRLTNDSGVDNRPKWSPDGTKIAFMSNRAGNDEIYVMNADGSNVTRLTNDVANDASPAWSANGSKLVFVSDRDGSGMQVHVMNADGSNVVRLTQTGENRAPDWSPDGTRIAFTRVGQCFDYYYYYYYVSCDNVFVMNADGTGVVQLTSDTYDAEPEWSRDGKWIAFESGVCGYYGCYAYGISAIKPDGKGRTAILTGDMRAPTWRP